jgi:hypothetical protein
LPEVLDLDDLLEEDVDLSAAVTRQVVVLDHTDEIGIGQIVYLLRYFAN